MTDDAPQRSARAAQAKQVLEHELFVEAFTKLEADYIKGWRESHARDTDARERLWQALQILGKVKGHLASYVQDGKLAQREIDLLADRQRPFSPPR
jgi:predicted metal-dependent hydrolase